MSITTISRRVTPSAYPVNPAPKPTMSITDMAKLENLRAAQRDRPVASASDPIRNQSEGPKLKGGQKRVFDFIAANPGAQTEEICKAMGVKVKHLSNMIYRLREKGIGITARKSKHNARYWVQL